MQDLHWLMLLLGSATVGLVKAVLCGSLALITCGYGGTGRPMRRKLIWGGSEVDHDVLVADWLLVCLGGLV